ncbi:hypothetical protein CK230_26505 [Mesorhizobium sp. WSM3859]|nr:hypothetical protein CK230_26505 [Mesorhizobium sp. WSM3859]
MGYNGHLVGAGCKVEQGFLVIGQKAPGRQYRLARLAPLAMGSTNRCTTSNSEVRDLVHDGPLQ